MIIGARNGGSERAPIRRPRRPFTRGDPEGQGDGTAGAARRWQHRRGGQRRPAREATDPSKTRKAPQPKLKPVPEAAVSAVGETLREQGLAAPPVGSGTTFLQAKTANEVLKAQERRLRLQKLKGELIDRARALSLVFRLARQERDVWVNWPARAAALMAADLGVEQPAAMQKVLEKHVRAQLDELAEVKPDLR